VVPSGSTLHQFGNDRLLEYIRRELLDQQSDGIDAERDF
jgi:hypothetical protein